MANELSANYNGSATLYSILRRISDGKVWNGSTFVTWADGDVASYDVPLASKGGDWYAADFPTSIASGRYRVDNYLQAGGSPATTDVRLSGYARWWNGTSAGELPDEGGYEGRYCTQGDLERVRGDENVATWSTKGGNDSAPDVLAIQQAIEAAENEVDEIVGRRYALPLDWSGVAGSLVTLDGQRLRDLSESLAAYNLYKARGLADTDTAGAKMQAEADEARSRLNAIGDGVVAFHATRIAASRTKLAPFVVL